jgi:hypothetical protein
VTFVRDNNLFIVPVESVGGGTVVQLTDVSAAPRPIRAHRQPEVHQGRRSEDARLGRAGSGAPQAPRRARSRRALPKFEIGERQNIADAALSGDGKFAFSSSTIARSRAPRRCRASSANRLSPKRSGAHVRGRRAGSPPHRGAQSRERRGGVGGLDGVSDPIAIPKPPFGDEPRPAAKPDPAPKRDVRWGNPILSPDGRIAVSSVRAADNTERWLVRSIRRPARPRCSITSRTRRGSGRRAGLAADNKRVWFLAEHDGWMHLYTVDATAPSPARSS